MLVLIGISSVITVYLCELVCFSIKRYNEIALNIWPARDNYVIARKLGIKEFDTRTPYDIYREESKNDSSH